MSSRLLSPGLLSSGRGPIIVKKFGGSSVADVASIRRVAKHVVDAHNAGQRVVVVVSAMGKTTDQLLELARQAAEKPDRRELDMLLSVGERITMALLAMAIRDHGVAATSLTGSQSGIITNDQQGNARIVEVRPYRVEDALNAGHVVIVAGFQGVSYRREVTTLGRGGSDTTAVALAAALGAKQAEIYSDIDGVYSADPRVELDARRLAEIDHGTMLELARSGARVLSAEAVAYAQRAGIALFVRAADGRPGETLVRVGMPAPQIGLCGVALREDAALWRYDLDAEQDGALSELLQSASAAVVLDGRAARDDRLVGTLLVAREPGDKTGDAHRSWLASARRFFTGRSQAHEGTLVTAVMAGHLIADADWQTFRGALPTGAGLAVLRFGSCCCAVIEPTGARHAIARIHAALGASASDPHGT